MTARVRYQTLDLGSLTFVGRAAGSKWRRQRPQEQLFRQPGTQASSSDPGQAMTPDTVLPFFNQTIDVLTDDLPVPYAPRDRRI